MAWDLEKRRAWYKVHKEKILKYNRDWRSINKKPKVLSEEEKQKRSEYNRAYAEKTKEARREKVRQAKYGYYLRNKEKCDKLSQEWKDRNREKIKSYYYEVTKKRSDLANIRSSKAARERRKRAVKNPALPIKRAHRKYRNGDISLDEFVNESREQLSHLSGELERIWRESGLCGSPNKDNRDTSEDGSISGSSNGDLKGDKNG